MRQRWRVLATAAAATAAVAFPVHGQRSTRTATSVATIEQYPGFFHGRSVAIVATPVHTDRWYEVPLTAPRRLVILPQSGEPPTDRTELHGVLFDVGHLSPDDGQIDALGIRAVATTLSPGRWPDRSTLFVLANATWVEPPDATPTLRAIVLSPDSFVGQSVTVRGRFRAQNLFGDLPSWPRQSKWDFVLQAVDASLWIAGIRPKGKGFDFDPATRRNAGTWLEAAGTVRVVSGLPLVEAASLRTTKADEEAAVTAAPPPPGPAPTVIFSEPLDGEHDIDPAAPVRIQFSRNMKAASFEGQVTATYTGQDGSPPPLSATYAPDTRSVDVRFASPLAQGATVVIHLGGGIQASDGAAMAPATITFRTKR